MKPNEGTIFVRISVPAHTWRRLNKRARANDRTPDMEMLHIVSKTLEGEDVRAASTDQFGRSLSDLSPSLPCQTGDLVPLADFRPAGLPGLFEDPLDWADNTHLKELPDDDDGCAGIPAAAG